MIAVVEKTLREKKGRELRGAAVSVFGATGVVGTASGVIAALEGASVTFVGREGTERAARHAAEVNRRFGVNIAVADGSTAGEKDGDPRGDRSRAVHGESRRAGARRRSDRRARRNCWSPPTSTRCRRSASKAWMLHANGTPLGERGALGIGALAIGNVKYRTEFGPVQADDREQDRRCASTSARRSTWRARSREVGARNGRAGLSR